MKKRLNAEIQKPKIVKQFYKTILAEGFEGASIAKVAKRMKIHPSLILHYFGSKENLTLALVDYVIEAYGQLLIKYRSEDIAPEDRLTGLLEVIWSREYYEKISVAGSFAVLSVSFRHRKIHDKIRQMYRVFKRFLVHELNRLTDSGVAQIPNPEQAAEMMMTLIEGSRHFRAFIIGDDDARIQKYNQEMIAAARNLITGAQK